MIKIFVAMRKIEIHWRNFSDRHIGIIAIVFLKYLLWIRVVWIVCVCVCLCMCLCVQMCVPICLCTHMSTVYAYMCVQMHRTMHSHAESMGGIKVSCCIYLHSITMKLILLLSLQIGWQLVSPNDVLISPLQYGWYKFVYVCCTAHHRIDAFLPGNRRKALGSRKTNKCHCLGKLKLSRLCRVHALCDGSSKLLVQKTHHTWRKLMQKALGLKVS